MAAESEETKDSIDHVFVIGRNGFGQFGLGHTNDIKELTKWTQNICIKRIHPGGCFTIITDKNDNIWCTGYNANGQLGLGHFNDNTQKFIQNEYFSDNNINIKSIMTNAYCYTSFFLSQTNNLYGCGWNKFNQLAIQNENKKSAINNKQNIAEPLLINNVSNMKYVSGGEYHTILLDNNGTVYSTQVTYEYYKVGQNGDGLHNFNNNNNNIPINGFAPIPFFRNKRITQISAGCFHSLFLDCHSGVWSCGDNGYGQLGLSHFKDMSLQNPQLIPYFFFANNTIPISKICCGGYHNLVVDDLKNIYAFGNNIYGQCGLLKDIDKTSKPVKISSLSKHNIIDIKCGFNHSYCKSSDNKHWLFGYNEYNECNLSQNNENVNSIYEPFCINEIVNKISNGEPIKEVYIGYENTWIITGSNSEISDIDDESKEFEIIVEEIKQYNYVLTSLDVKNGCVKCFDDNYNELEFIIDKKNNDLIKQIINTQNKGIEMKQDVFITINEIFYSNQTKKQIVIKSFINDGTEIINVLQAKHQKKDSEIALLKEKLAAISQDKNKYTIEEWLKDIVGLPQYIENFVENGFDMEIVMDVTMDELRDEIKIKKLGHRKKIMKAIKNILNTT